LAETENEPARVSAADGAGSAMRFFGCAGDPACAGEDRFCNHINRIGSQSYPVGRGAV